MKIVSLLIICFVYLFAEDTKRIELEIAKIYMSAYPSISISSVNVSPTLINEESNLTFLSIEQTGVNILRDKGQVVVLFKTQQNDVKKKIYRYVIDASTDACRTKNVIAKDQTIEIESLEPILLKIASFSDRPLACKEAMNQNAKHFIGKGMLIFQRDVGALADIRKGQTINASYLDKMLEANIEVIALEDGQKGQIISVKNKGGKILKVKVIGKDRVEIE